METGPWDTYIDAVTEAYRLARGEESARLRGRRVRRFDGRGVHPFSEACGRIRALMDVPEIWEACETTPDRAGYLIAVDPLGLQQAARVDALTAFIQDAKEGELDEEHDSLRAADLRGLSSTRN